MDIFSGMFKDEGLIKNSMQSIARPIFYGEHKSHPEDGFGRSAKISESGDFKSSVGDQ